MRRLMRVVVGGLFDELQHEINFRADQPTILTGPNGVGKTHVLTIIHAALLLNVRELARLPFESVELRFNDTWRLTIKRKRLPQACAITFSPARTRVAGKPVTVEVLDREPEEGFPPFLEQTYDGRWLDLRTGRYAHPASVQRYSDNIDRRSSVLIATNPAIQQAVDGIRPILIDTKRLDTIPARQSSTSPIGESGRGGAARIQQYTDRIRVNVETARRASVAATQSADLSFAERALAAAHDTVNEAELHKRYDGIVKQYQDLTRNGLAIGQPPVPFPEKTGPTVRRILNIFLNDWENRLAPLLPLNARLQALRQILDHKLSITGKSTRITPEGSLAFNDRNGNRIRVSLLSSGEQHLVALFAMLLFAANEGSLVLIDEPEISMHAAWKHAFLGDVKQVSRLANIQMVLATHSTGIVNGQWDLTEELSYLPVRDQSPAVEDVSSDTEPEEWLE